MDYRNLRETVRNFRQTSCNGPLLSQGKVSRIVEPSVWLSDKSLENAEGRLYDSEMRYINSGNRMESGSSERRTRDPNRFPMRCPKQIGCIIFQASHAFRKALNSYSST